MVKISVIVPCFNVEEYLEECLDSIVNQTFKDIEIICVNDGSTDNTLEILNSYAERDNRFKIISQTNQGLSMARNIGLDNVTGEYVAFIDSDDFFDLNAFEEILEITEEKELDFLMFKLINFDEDTYEKSEFGYFEMDFVKEIVGDRVFSFEDIGERFYYMSVTAPGKLFRHDLIRDLRFPQDLIFEDNPFFVEVMFNSKRIYFYDKHLYYRRIRSTSITQSSTDKFYHTIEIFNMINDITKRYGYFDRFQRILYRRKLSDTHRYLTLVNEEDKEFYFERMKEDFIKYQDEYLSSEAFYQIPRRLQLVFHSAIEVDNYREYELIIENFDWNFSNEEIRKDNRKLNKEIGSLKEFNSKVLSSRSWKITEPLRKFANLFR